MLRRLYDFRCRHVAMLLLMLHIACSAASPPRVYDAPRALLYAACFTACRYACRRVDLRLLNIEHFETCAMSRTRAMIRFFASAMMPRVLRARYDAA